MFVKEIKIPQEAIKEITELFTRETFPRKFAALAQKYPELGLYHDKLFKISKADLEQANADLPILLGQMIIALQRVKIGFVEIAEVVSLFPGFERGCGACLNQLDVIVKTHPQLVKYEYTTCCVYITQGSEDLYCIERAVLDMLKNGVSTEAIKAWGQAFN